MLALVMAPLRLYGTMLINSFGSKQFPALHEITIETQATAEKKRIRAKFELNGFSDRSDWETITTPSSSYTKVRVEDILGKLMNL